MGGKLKVREKPGDHKEMPSVLAAWPIAPLYMSPNAVGWRTDKKENQIFLIYKEFSVEQLQSHI